MSSRNWLASSGPHGYGAHDGVTVTDNRGLVVAVAVGDVPELDAMANARLIAAAPDLLAALNRLINATAILPPSMDEPGSAMAQARAAIRKATTPA